MGEWEINWMTEVKNKKEFARPTLNLLDDDQISKLHNASLDILLKTGVNIHCDKTRALLKKSGAKVYQDLRVYIPSELVERALSTAPSCINMFDRDGNKAMVLEKTNIYFGTGSDLMYTIDSQNQIKRDSVLKDVELAARVCEKLPNIDFVMSYALPKECAQQDCEIKQFQTMLENTKKPIVMTNYSEINVLEKMHKLACESCGGESSFIEKPNYILYSQLISPLQHHPDAIDRLIFCAQNRIPIIYVPTIMMGASGPVTLAGAIALASAECLAGLVIHQLYMPGAPFIYGGNVSPLDMKTSVFSFGTPEWRLADAAISQLSLYYNLPCFGTGGGSDSKTIDLQAGIEWSYTLLMSALSGNNLIHDVGYLESGLTGSLESFIVCNEIIDLVKRIIAGFKIDKGTLALELIKEIGPAGSFMGTDHTVKWFRESIWYPSLFNRSRSENLQSGIEENILIKARKQLKDLLA